MIPAYYGQDQKEIHLAKERIYVELEAIGLDSTFARTGEFHIDTLEKMLEGWGRLHRIYGNGTTWKIYVQAHNSLARKMMEKEGY